MKSVTFALSVASLAILVSCGDVTSYPVSGEACTPSDAVQDMGPPPCPEGMSGL